MNSKQGVNNLKTKNPSKQLPTRDTTMKKPKS